MPKVHRIFDEETSWVSDDVVVWKALVEEQGHVDSYYITSTSDVYQEAKKQLSRWDTIDPYILNDELQPTQDN